MEKWGTLLFPTLCPLAWVVPSSCLNLTKSDRASQSQPARLIFVAPLSTGPGWGEASSSLVVLFIVFSSTRPSGIPTYNFLQATPFSVQINSCKYTSGTASPIQPERSRFLFRFSQGPYLLIDTTHISHSTAPTACPKTTIPHQTHRIFSLQFLFFYLLLPTVSPRVRVSSILN